MSLAAAIKAEARRLGFPLVGISTPDPPLHVDAFERWLAAGYHGQMAYLAGDRARQRRADPRLILPECQSILVLGMPYPAYAGGRPEQLVGRVAAYACGVDYHEDIPPRLRALVAFIEAQVGRSISQRWYTDTGPLLERDLAQRAGLGWIGKNTCLIHPQWGSYFFLAEILLDMALEIDEPFAFDRCGSCTRCLEACPTGCILPGRVLDASRCLAYLTIELKGAIPEDLRFAVGDWVFGCDVCQQVCPWNAKRLLASTAPDATFQPRLEAEMALTGDEFNRKFKSTPVLRARRRGYLRNVAVALGNTHSAAALPHLIAALQSDPEPLVRAHVAWALGEISNEQACQALRTAAQSELDVVVQGEIRTALSKAER
jgi:epoxyqueuosine reductase